MNLASDNADTFTIGTPLENNDGNVDSLLVYANTEFKNNVTIGSCQNDTVLFKSTISGSLGNITASSLCISGGTIFYNGVDLLNREDSPPPEDEIRGIVEIIPEVDIITRQEGGTVYISFDTSSLDRYKFLENESSYPLHPTDKTVYFSFNPHYNNVRYFPWNNNSPRLKSQYYAVSDITMSFYLPHVQDVLGKTFTFVNATYVGTSAFGDQVGYDEGNIQTTYNGLYSVHKVYFFPRPNEYIGSSKITNKSSLSCYLITNDIGAALGEDGYLHSDSTHQRNFITLQAVSSSLLGYTWVIRDIHDYQPFNAPRHFNKKNAFYKVI